MSEEEIKEALSIEVVECGSMAATWKEVHLLWNDEVISVSQTFDYDNGE